VLTALSQQNKRARNIQRACEAGGQSDSPRRWRSRAWGTAKFKGAEPTKVGDIGDGGRFALAKLIFEESAIASFAGSVVFSAGTPRLGFAIAWGYHSVRLLRRLVEGCHSTRLDDAPSKCLA